LDAKNKHEYLEYNDNQMTLEELKTNSFKLDPENKHLYLNDSAFESLFGMDKEKFRNMNRFR